jgi:putative membrane protein
MGWFGLFFQTLSAGKDGGGHQSVAPLAREEEMAAILAEQGMLHLPNPPELEMVSGRHLLRTLISNAAVPLAVILAAAINWRPALFLLALMPLLLGMALLERRFHRYGLVGDLLFVRRGVWRQQLWILPVAKAQTIRLSRSFLQRKLGLASLLVDTAGAPIMNAPRIVDLREHKARSLAAAIAERLRHAGYDSGRKSGTDR